MYVRHQTNEQAKNKHRSAGSLRNNNGIAGPAGKLTTTKRIMRHGPAASGRLLAHLFFFGGFIIELNHAGSLCRVSEQVEAPSNTRRSRVTPRALGFYLKHTRLSTCIQSEIRTVWCGLNGGSVCPATPPGEDQAMWLSASFAFRSPLKHPRTSCTPRPPPRPTAFYQ